MNNATITIILFARTNGKTYKQIDSPRKRESTEMTSSQNNKRK
jgi:hypothetical protein